jgi:hypothetical protein
MAKKIVSDMIVSPKKSIRDIPISLEKKPVSIKKPTVNYRSNRRPMNPKFVIWVIAVIALLALFFGVSVIFSSATLAITPRIEKVVFNNETYSGVAFEVLNINKEDGMIVEATEEKVANQKASGKIVIYNNYSSASQRLINNTRFEATNGKIYRISNSVDVPGTKIVSGKTIPGSVEVTVYADEPGDTYNLKLSDLAGDFKIPGFKGSPRYDSFYARLKTDITGGLIGKQKVVAESVRKVAEDTLKASLKENLLKELYSIKPDNYIIFANSYSIEYSALPDSGDSADKVSINLKGTLNSVVFNSLKLANYIANKKVADFDGLPVSIIFNDDLTTTFVAKDLTNLWKNKTIDIKFNGPANIKWIYDVELIKKDLAGQAGAETVQILAKYKEQVKSIKVSFSPIWTKYFPDNLERIKVEEVAL